jgi:hypothetical protein
MLPLSSGLGVSGSACPCDGSVNASTPVSYKTICPNEKAMWARNIQTQYARQAMMSSQKPAKTCPKLVGNQIGVM